MKNIVLLILVLCFCSCANNDTSQKCQTIKIEKFIEGLSSSNDSILSQYFEAKRCNYNEEIVVIDSTHLGIQKLYAKWFTDRYKEIVNDEVLFMKRYNNIICIADTSISKDSICTRTTKHKYISIPDSFWVATVRSIDDQAIIDSFKVATPYIPDIIIDGKSIPIIKISDKEQQISDSILWKKEYKWRSLKYFANPQLITLRNYLDLVWYHWGSGFHIRSMPLINRILISQSGPSIKIEYMRNITNAFASDVYREHGSNGYTLFSTNYGPDQ